MYETFLLGHITFGTLSLAACMLVICKFVFKKNINYMSWMKLIAALSLLSTGSGVGLYFSGPQLSILNFCLRLGLYLAVILFTEVVLYLKHKNFVNLASTW